MTSDPLAEKRHYQKQRIVSKLLTAWHRVPSWRLGQLVSNLLGAGVQDVFHPSDTEWETALDKFLRESRTTPPPPEAPPA